ncbi:MAG: hypothetical protein FWE86_01130 [Oscillospiraceae bacterium]|nr:hypothetical protein [Oscillospiraceae bacterium]
MTKKAMFKYYCDNFMQRKDKILLAICGITAIALGLLAFLAQGSVFLLDMALLVGLALGAWLGKSRVCAILLTAYGLLNVIAILSAVGTFEGWPWLIPGVLGLFGTLSVHKGFNEFLAQGQAQQPQAPYAAPQAPYAPQPQAPYAAPQAPYAVQPQYPPQYPVVQPPVVPELPPVVQELPPIVQEILDLPEQNPDIQQ